MVCSQRTNNLCSVSLNMILISLIYWFHRQENLEDLVTLALNAQKECIESYMLCYTVIAGKYIIE